MNTPSVRNNTATSRFELWRNGRVVGHLDYLIRGSIIDLTHAEVGPSARGEGLGAVLTKGALDLISQGALRVVPTCPFVASYIEQHQEYQPLLSRG